MFLFETVKIQITKICLIFTELGCHLFSNTFYGILFLSFVCRNMYFFDIPTDSLTKNGTLDQFELKAFPDGKINITQK